MERDHLAFLREASEALSLLSGDDVDAFLNRIVALLTSHIRTDVASVYLYDKHSRSLVLRATQGLAPASVGRVRLSPGEGLVGHVFDTLEPVCERAASRNPMFKRVVGINEEPFESFLAVPLRRGSDRLGVLVAQRREADFFGQPDLVALQALASQLANAIDNAQVLAQAPALIAGAPAPPRYIAARVVSPGFASGPAVQVTSVHVHRRLAAGPFVRRYTTADLQAALQATDAELAELERRFSDDLPEMAALIFNAHQLILMDAQFGGAILKRVEAGENPPEAVVAVARDSMERFESHPDPYIQDKAADIEDLAARLLSKLLGSTDTVDQLPPGAIALARSLYPSHVVELYAQGAHGIVLGHSGDTSHVALLIRSLGIPSVTVDFAGCFELEDGTPLLLDAETGAVYIDPPRVVLEGYRTRHAPPSRATADSMKCATVTRDGVRLHLLANINLLGEVPTARRLQAEGVGLYRSEFPFLLRPAFPSEEEQVILYLRLFQEMGNRPVTIRTLDLGGDKIEPHHMALDEDNPQLGLRSLRFSLRHPALFHQQLRAILRGAVDAVGLRIMFPMVGGLDEYRVACSAVAEAEASLAHDGLPHYRRPELGMMVELPSTVALIDEFAREAAFFSVGTNDFVQYLLGVDRGNHEVAQYYCPEHPAVLRAIHRIARVATRHGREVSICGEMAHELRFLAYFVGIGIRHFSVPPTHLPSVQGAAESLDAGAATIFARRVLRCRDLDESRRVLGAGP
jgi:phosphotransferase system enzyme I (PtsP)